VALGSELLLYGKSQSITMPRTFSGKGVINLAVPGSNPIRELFYRDFITNGLASATGSNSARMSRLNRRLACDKGALA
jgi:hypothetical protein